MSEDWTREPLYPRNEYLSPPTAWDITLAVVTTMLLFVALPMGVGALVALVLVHGSAP